MKRLLYFIAGFSLLFASCKKNDKGGNVPLTINSFLPSSGMAGTLVTINGRGFGEDTLTNAVSFSGVKTSIFQVTDSSLVVIAPSGGKTGPVVVTAGGRQVTAGTYTYQTLSIHTVTPLNGPAGTNVTISGAGFTSPGGLPVVTFNGHPATVVNAGDTILVVSVPDTAGVGPIVVSVNGETATGPVFSYENISAITPLTGGAATQVTLHGVGFGTDPSKVTVAFNGVVTPVISITADTLIVVKAPSGVKTGAVSITINNEVTVGPVFTVVPPPTVKSLTPYSGLPGASIVIAGTNFSTVPSENQVLFNGTPATVTQATGTQLTVTAPMGATTGAVTVNVNGQQVQGPVFTFQVLNITALTPNNGLAGTTVVITGNGYDATPANNQVLFNGVAAAITQASATQLTVTVPNGVTSGPVTLKVGTLTALGPVFSRAGVSTFYSLPVSEQGFNGIACDASGNVYFTQGGNSSIQKLSPGGTVSTFAGNPTVTGGSATDGPLSGALFSANIGKLGYDADGNMYVADNGNQVIREITASGTVKTLVTNVPSATGFGVSNGELVYGVYIYGAGSGLYTYNPALGTYAYSFPGAQNFNPQAVATDPLGNIYYSDQYGGNYVHEYSFTGTTVATYSGFTNINSLCQDPTTGNIIAMDGSAYRLVMFDKTTLTVTTLMQASGYGLTDGNFSQAKFSGTGQIAVDPTGAIYIIDQSNGQYSAIRKIYTQ